MDITLDARYCQEESYTLNKQSLWPGGIRSVPPSARGGLPGQEERIPVRQPTVRDRRYRMFRLVFTAAGGIS